jgi:hypothetical protein
MAEISAALSLADCGIILSAFILRPPVCSETPGTESNFYIFRETGKAYMPTLPRKAASKASFLLPQNPVARLVTISQ